MTNFKNNDRFIVSTLRCVPLQIAQTGTITTLKQAVTGVGTNFSNTNLFQVDDWIWNGGYELRRIIEIRSDTLMMIEEGFTVELAGSAFSTVKASRMSSISYMNPSGTTVAVSGIDGMDVQPGESGTWTKSSRTHSSSQRDFIDPVVVDGSTAGAPLTILTVK
jgi:hypothetical protein